MLIENKNLDKGTVVTLKILGGDELVARLDEPYVRGQNVSLVKPVVIMIGQQGFGMMPFMLTSEEEKIVLPYSVVLCVAKTHKSVTEEYIKQTTGLLSMGS